MTTNMDLKFYRERWKAVEEIERQELRAMSIEKHWKQINNLIRFAIENGLTRGDDDDEMEVKGKCVDKPSKKVRSAGPNERRESRSSSSRNSSERSERSSSGSSGSSSPVGGVGISIIGVGIGRRGGGIGIGF